MVSLHNNAFSEGKEEGLMNAAFGITGALLALIGLYLIHKSNRLRRYCTLPALARAVPPDDQEAQNNIDHPTVFIYTVGSKTLRGCAADKIKNAAYEPGDVIKIMVNPENPSEFITERHRSIPRVGVIFLLTGAVLIVLALSWR